MKSVLIIEDDAVLRAATYMVLTEEGFNVKTADNGKEGIKLLEKYIFDIVLCDINMPEMNGYQVINFLKMNSKILMPVFIYLTEKSTRVDLRKGMELGADDYIIKPFTREELLSSLSTQIQKKEQCLRKYNIEKDLLELLKSKIIPELNSKKLPQVNADSKYNYESSIFLTDGKKSGFVKISNIIFINSSKDYTKINIKDSKPYFIRKTIKIWEKDLPKNYFVRIHRSTIVNTNYVKKIVKISNYTHEVFLESIKEPVQVSQRYFLKFRKQVFKS